MPYGADRDRCFAEPPRSQPDNQSRVLSLWRASSPGKTSCWFSTAHPFLYLPPYSPELNPKENLWDEIRVTPRFVV
jgi:hypothetical protein